MFIFFDLIFQKVIFNLIFLAVEFGVPFEISGGQPYISEVLDFYALFIAVEGGTMNELVLEDVVDKGRGLVI